MIEEDDTMKRKKKIAAFLGALLFLQVGTACQVGDRNAGDSFSAPAIVHAETVPVWQADVDEATRDDTMAFGLYIGKPIQAFIDDCTAKGWKRIPNEKAVFFRTKKDGYMTIISKRIAMYSSTRTTEQDIQIILTKYRQLLFQKKN